MKLCDTVMLSTNIFSFPLSLPVSVLLFSLFACGRVFYAIGRTIVFLRVFYAIFRSPYNREKNPTCAVLMSQTTPKCVEAVMLWTIFGLASPCHTARNEKAPEIFHVKGTKMEFF